VNIREQRIRQLLDQIKVRGIDPYGMNKLLLLAQDLFPYARKETVRSYCIAVMDSSLWEKEAHGEKKHE